MDEYEKEECPFYSAGNCSGDVHIVDSGMGYISVACDVHAELVAVGEDELLDASGAWK